MAINLKEDIKPISYIKTNAADMMKYVTEVRNPIVIRKMEKRRRSSRYCLLSRHAECIQFVEKFLNYLKANREREIQKIRSSF